MENCCTAVVTPMKNGKIDVDAFDRLIEFQVQNGVQDIVVNGTTGESPTTSDEEKANLIRHALDKKANVIAGCGTNSTEHSEHLTREAQALGSNRILLVDCYYNGPSSMELSREYYGYLCEKFPDLAFVAYVIPGRTGCELSVEDLVVLHNRYPNLDTVKEATGNLERMRKTRSLSNITIMSGDDDLTYNIMSDPAIGGKGVISVMSNIAPRAIQDFCKVVNNHELGAESLAKILSSLFSLVTVKLAGQKFRNPVPIKTAMAGLGMIAYDVRRPLGRMTKDATTHVRNMLRTIWQNSPNILEPIEKFYGVSIEDRLANDSYWPSY